MKISYGVENLRSLKKTPDIEIKPITILLGRNSIGKSSFLRSLLLIRQSLETRTSAPILWSGDLVDFGNFETSVHNQDIDNDIILNFRIQNLENKIEKKDWFPLLTAASSPLKNVPNLYISYTISGNREKTTLKSMRFSDNKDNEGVKVEFDPKFDSTEFDRAISFSGKIEFNGVDTQRYINNTVCYTDSDNLFSEAVYFTILENKTTLNLEENIFEIITNKLKEEINDKRINLSTYKRQARVICNLSSFNDDQIDFLNSSLLNQKFSKFYTSLREGKKQKTREFLSFMVGLLNHIRLYRSVEKEISATFQNIQYIGPARAQTERYYRHQELRVSEISPDGHNLPIFLSSLAQQDLQEFSDFVKSIFKYGVSIDKAHGHISINLTSGASTVNVADTGYGVSQILPVVAQAWWAQKKNINNNKKEDTGNNVPILAIEQPELHLHPAHQTKLARVFAQAAIEAKENDTEVKQRYIIETHSEAMVNELAELVRTQQINPEDIQILIFEPESTDDKATNIRTATFDIDGNIENWPYGFFDYY